MSCIVIQDLAHSAAMDKRALSAVRGGFGPASGFGLGKDINVTVNSNQNIAQFQQIGISVLNNNGVIGAGFAAPDVNVAASLWAENKLALR
jgi:hypothetical protein